MAEPAQMQDRSSLYNEVKKLIAIRKEHKALMSNGEIEFVYAEKNSYPLAYLRTSGEERILVVINPSAEPQELECGYAPKNTVYSFGGEISSKEGKISVPACSAGFYMV